MFRHAIVADPHNNEYPNWLATALVTEASIVDPSVRAITANSPLV